MSRALRVVSLVAIVGPALLWAFIAPVGATAQTSGGATVSTTALRGDTVRVIGSWAAGCTGADCTTEYLVNWVANGSPAPTKTTPHRRDTLFVVRAACPTQAIVQLAVVGLRRGVPSQGSTTTRNLGCVNTPPPPVDSLRIDTLALYPAQSVASVDSSRVDQVAIDRVTGERVWVHAVYEQGTPRTYRALGAQVGSVPVRCTRGEIRWNVPDTLSWRVALARAAQWPVDTLRARARYALASTTLNAPAVEAARADCLA